MARTRERTAPVAAKVYSWRDNSRISVEAAVFGRIVERIERTKTVATAADIVEEARPTDSPLHAAFNWDDAAAAELYREEQARGLLRSLRVEVRMAGESKPQQVVAYVAVNRGDARGYVNTATVMADVNMRQLVLDEARRALAGWRNRYKHLEELADIVAAIDSAGV